MTITLWFVSLAIGSFVTVQMGLATTFNGLSAFHSTETIEGVRRVVVWFVENQVTTLGRIPEEVRTWSNELSYETVAERVNLKPIDIICAYRWFLGGAGLASVVLILLIWAIPDLSDTAVKGLCVGTLSISLTRAVVASMIATRLQGFAALRETAAPWRFLS